jgi:hypothetical protein
MDFSWLQCYFYAGSSKNRGELRPGMLGVLLAVCCGLEREGFMFEAPKETKQSSSTGLIISIVVILVVGAASGYYFLQGKGDGSKQAAAMHASAAQLKDADAVRDLKIQRATMNKDRNGAMTVWAVSVENKSSSFSYSKIKYETTYVGADNSVLMVNQGTIADTIGPGEQSTLQANDPLFPAGTATYRFKITGATPAVP